jgi:hypothetical protein
MPSSSIPLLPCPINLLDDWSVVTRDGEHLGKWTTDEADTFFQFIPDGQTEAVIENVFKGALCKEIMVWLEDKAG